MRSKKIMLAGALDHLMLLDLLKHIKQPSLTVVNYHRIYDGAVDTRFDPGVFEASAAHFDAQISWLKRNFDPMSEADIVDFARSGKPLTGRHVAVTFDDAYIDNYTIAYPILKRYDMPATFFVPTAMIENRRVGWWDLISYYINESVKPIIEIRGRSFELKSAASRDTAFRRVQRAMKNLDEAETHNLVAELSEACDVPRPSADLESAQLMTWEELREVSRNGVAIGSHTHTHRVLSRLSRFEQLNELRTSKELLEKRIGGPVRSLAYPVGGPDAFTEESKSIVSEVGYEAAFAFYGGVNSGRIHDRFSISRIPAPRNLSLYKATVTLPSVFV